MTEDQSMPVDAEGSAAEECAALAASPPAVTTRQWLLGIFVVGQLLFLLFTNLVGFLRDFRSDMGEPLKRTANRVTPDWAQDHGHLNGLVDALMQMSKHYSQATGQYQSWSLFAPSVGAECVFPAILYRWDNDPATDEISLWPPETRRLLPALATLAARSPLDALVLSEGAQHALDLTEEPDLVLSANKPADMRSYLRLGHFRLRRYECNFVPTLRPYDLETPEETLERYRRRIREQLDEYGEIIEAYLKRRVAEVEKERGRKPTQVIVLLKRYHIVEPEKREKERPFYLGPFVVPLARWRLNIDKSATHWLLEAYDPTSGIFVERRR